MSLLIRRGTDAERQTITPLEAEIIYTTDLKEVWIGDGTTLGGVPVGVVAASSLQDVTDVGNTTTNDIQFGTGAGILFDNGARVREGTTNAGLGGYKGVALKCSVDYEFKWEAGRLYVMEQDGFTIRGVFYNFSFAPTSSDDDTLGFVVGSRWVLDNGDVYYCSDATTGSAVWDLIDASGKIYHGIASGVDTYTTTIAGVSSLSDGDAFIIRFTNGNTDQSTLDINGLGAISLYKSNDGEIIGGDIPDDCEMLCVYNDAIIPYFKCIATSPNSLFAYVTNADSVTINKGEAVYAFGSAGDRMSVKLAYNTTDATSAQTYGLVYSSSIAAGQKGIIIIQGVINGLNLGSYTSGDPVYLGSTAGAITKVKPSAPNHLVYIGVVEKANAGNGSIYVRVQNGYEVEELHNAQITSATDDEVLQYVTGSPNLWKNKSIAQIKKGQIFIEMNGQGGVIQAPSYTGVANITKSGTITGWTLFSINQSTGLALSGSISIDVWIGSAGSVPTIANTIFSGTKPNLSSQSYNSATGLNISMTAGQTIMAKVESSTTCVFVNLQLQYTTSQ